MKYLNSSRSQRRYTEPITYLQNERFELIYWMGNYEFIEGKGEDWCRSVKSLSNPSIPFRVWGGILRLLFFYKRRGLRSFFKWGITNFSYFIEGEGERTRCRSVNSLLYPPITFRVWRGIFILLFSHKVRGLHLLFECGIMNFSRERGKGLGVGQPILY